jgi:hypothetical protein
LRPPFHLTAGSAAGHAKGGVIGRFFREDLRRPDQTWKVRMIEEEFQRLMFDGDDV